jgi:hypothetical protein
MKPLGTRSPGVISAFLSIRPDMLRDWKRRGLIGRTCDVQTHREGYDIAAVATVSITLRKTRPRRVLDESEWRSHAERVR